MARMYSNDKCPSGNSGDSSQLINWILDSGSTGHMMPDVSDNRRTERTTWKCLRCGSEDRMIAKCPKPPKDNEKRQKQVRFN